MTVLSLLSATESTSLTAERMQQLLGLALLLSGIVIVPMVIALGKLWIPERNNFFARWGFTHFVQIVLMWLATTFLLSLVWTSIAGEETSLQKSLLFSALVFLGPTLLIFRFAAKLDPDGIRCLGLRGAGSLRSVLYGLSAYALLLPALFGTTLIWPWLIEWVGIEHEAQEVMRAFLDMDPAQMVLPLLLAVVVLPFFEELVFRAFLQPLLVQNFREVGGVVLTSALFAALHGISVFLPVFVLALIMGGVMQRTQRFAACWAIHALHNGLMLALVLYSPGARELMDSSALLSLIF